MTRFQVATLLIAVALITCVGNYLATGPLRSTVAERTCRAADGILIIFHEQEKEAGATAHRLLAFEKALALTKDC